jgi:hypothetical protein
MIEISRRKAFLPITAPLRSYLQQVGRHEPLPATYEDLLSFRESYPRHDKEGRATHWSTVIYEPSYHEELWPKLTSIYSLLKTGEPNAVPHLYVERVDYCEFGNSKPFRVRVVNHYNDNYDHFYVKVADASRIYGLEFEHLLSPNRMSYLARGNTLVEEHIAGVPGDIFISNYLEMTHINKVRIAKEFVKFSERCFVRLLGDMRSYNYVIDMTPDFEEVQYRVRPIDFDQQSYEGRKNVYLPQFFKDNNPVVTLCGQCLNVQTVNQYKEEERTLIARRYLAERERLGQLLDCMKASPLEPVEKVQTLKTELAEYHHQPHAFERCSSMGDVLDQHLYLCLAKHLM